MGTAMNKWPIGVKWLGDEEPQHKQVVYLISREFPGPRPSVGEVHVQGEGFLYQFKVVILGSVQYDQLRELNVPASAEGEEWPGPIRDLRVDAYVFPRSALADALVRHIMQLYESLDAAKGKIETLTSFFKNVLKDYGNGKKEP